MELCDVLEGVEYEILQYGKKPLDIQGITEDSRTVQNGFAFICKRGLSLDGHRYISKAVESGATLIVCEYIQDPMPPDVTIVKVKSTRNALNRLAGNFNEHPANRMRLIGVTGTNGKTSVTYFLEAILKECGYTVGIIGTSGARTGDIPVDIPYATATTPDTIELHAIFAEMARRGTNYVVMEVSSHSLALDKIGGLEFAAGIFTNLTQDHLDFHGTMENYMIAKSKLFDYCRIGIINHDDISYSYMMEYASEHCNVLTYGIEGSDVNKKGGFPPDFIANNINFYSGGVSFDLIFNSENTRFELSIPGRFSVYNALSVISCSIALKLPMDKIVSGISHITNVPGRIQSIPNDRGVSVFVDYAHSEDSLRNVTQAVREFTEKRVITVFGCGGDRDRTKRPAMGEAVGRNSDFCIITSDNPRSENPEQILDDTEEGVKQTNCLYLKLVDRREAIFHAINMAQPGDSVIIAGKGRENYQEFENKRRIHFDDAETAREALERRSI